MTSSWNFLKTAVLSVLTRTILKAQPKAEGEIVGHGLTLWNATSEEFLVICNPAPIAQSSRTAHGITVDYRNHTKLKYMNRTPNFGFVTIIDENYKAISNPVDTKPDYSKDRKL